MLWRRSYSSRGFGFTLRGKDDFKIESFTMCDEELFTAHYGELDDGDITKGENIVSFAEFVVANSEGVSSPHRLYGSRVTVVGRALVHGRRRLLGRGTRAPPGGDESSHLPVPTTHGRLRPATGCVRVSECP